MFELPGFQRPGAAPAAPERARQKTPQAFTPARARRVVQRGGTRVVATVMFDHEMRVADAAHQYPAQKPVNAVAGMSQLMGHRDALRSGHKAHRQGNAQCKLPARVQGYPGGA